ncbi:MAG: glycosyltransferase family 2 protein [Phreatobacter sp.]|nr:glycosyltransferase family 2 protein [Phreatobacter sp.]
MRSEDFRGRLAERITAARIPAERRAPPQDRRGTAAPGRLVDDLVGPVERFRVEAAAGLCGVVPLEAALAMGLTSAEAIAAALSRRIVGMTTHLEGALPVVAADPATWQRVLARGMVGIVHPVVGKALLVAPAPAEAERLAAGTFHPPPGSLPVLVTTPQAFSRLIRAWAEESWVDATVPRLEREQPDMSAADRGLMARTAAAVMVALAALFVALVSGPGWLAMMAGGTIGACVSVWVMLRLAAAVARPQPLPRRPLRDDALPRYTILCALYREAAVVDALLTALRGLDYPRARLEIKLILEEDDPETLAAVRAAPHDPAVEVIVVPPCGPRTKPKALTMALPFARGDLFVVFDAEDRPEPGQLREAAETFAAGDHRLGCLQAPLSIVNDRDGWLARFFAAEYDALFRVLLPAFARAGLPVPLGGTSNHFRRAALDQSLGWDPYNVTEDADLGFRLARNGWRTGTITTPTREEAPPTFGGWFGQRSRWFKGWLQTLAVLSRDPRRLAGELGVRGLAALLATLAGSLGSALVHLVCLAAFLVTCLQHGMPSWAGPAAGIFALGYGGSIAYKTAGLARAGRLRLAPWLLLLPLAWIVMGLAALRAVVDLWRRPFHWEKTEHGAARWPAVASASAGDRGIPPDAIHRIVAFSEGVIASGRHQPREVAAALRRHCDRMRAAGAPEGLLAALEGYGCEVEARDTPG